MSSSPHPQGKQPSIAFYVLLGAALLAFIKTFPLISPIIFSFLLILLISLAVNPVVARMRAWTGGRKVATGLLTAGVIVVIILTGIAFFGPMTSSVKKLAEQMPHYWERLQKPLIKMEKQAKMSEEKIQAEVSKEIAQNGTNTASTNVSSTNTVSPNQSGVIRQTAQAPPTESAPAKEPGSLRSSLGGMLQGVVGGFSKVAVNTAQIMVILVTVFFGVIFTLMNPRPIFASLFSIIPERHHDGAMVIAQRIGKFVPAWAGSTLTGMFVIGLLVFLVMWPIFGFTDALVLGIIACVLESVPYLGPLLAAVPALLLGISKGGTTPLWVVLGYAAVQALENNVIIPFIMARGMKLHPVAVIFSMLLCVAAFGVLGVLVAAPMVAIVNILHDELYRKRFLPETTDSDLDRLARTALHEKKSDGK